MKSNAIKLVWATTIVLIAASILSSLNFSFSVIFYLVIFGQLLLIFTVYKVLTDDYKTDKTFDNWYEDHPKHEDE
mgnify:CR=1 FL=1